MAFYTNPQAQYPTTNTQPVSDWSSLIGAGAGALVNYFGNQNATNALTSGEQNAINTQTGLQSQLYGIYGNQTGIGNAADTSLGAQLGLFGTPNYSPFYGSPGYNFSVNQGDQAIQRAAAANGSLYTPNELGMIGQYNAGTASSNYNNYISQLMQSAGLGAQGNQGLSSGLTQASGNISQLQQNQGNANAGGAAGTAGIVSNLLGRVPWGQVGNYFNSSGSNSTGYVSNGIDTTNAGILNGYTSYPSNGYDSSNSSGYNSSGGNVDLSDNGILNGYTNYGDGSSGF